MGNTGCQRCYDASGCIDRKICDTRSCAPDTSNGCAGFKASGHCFSEDADWVKLMQAECDTTCYCGDWQQLGSESYYTAVTQGKDLGHPNGLSLEECQKLCEETEGCKSVHHCPKHSNYCWMKDRQLHPGDATKYSGYCSSYFMPSTR